jgi:hypothetical protein
MVLLHSVKYTMKPLTNPLVAQRYVLTSAWMRGQKKGLTDEQEIPLMYLPDAKIIWNGNTVSPNPIAISPFLDTLPLSRHDLQSLDCHPMPGKLNSTALAP